MVGSQVITFERYFQPGIGVRRPFTDPVRITPDDIRPSDREIGLLEQVWVNPTMTFRTVTIDGAVLEWATPLTKTR